MRYPEGWNKTLGELWSEDRDLEDQEIRWATEYERDQLRGKVRFPKNGEILNQSKM